MSLSVTKRKRASNSAQTGISTNVQDVHDFLGLFFLKVKSVANEFETENKRLMPKCCSIISGAVKDALINSVTLWALQRAESGNPIDYQPNFKDVAFECVRAKYRGKNDISTFRFDVLDELQTLLAQFDKTEFVLMC